MHRIRVSILLVIIVYFLIVYTTDLTPPHITNMDLYVDVDLVCTEMYHVVSY